MRLGLMLGYSGSHYKMPLDLIKTLTYLTIHLTVGFTVAYVMTGSVALAGGGSGRIWTPGN